MKHVFYLSKHIRLLLMFLFFSAIVVVGCDDQLLPRNMDTSSGENESDFSDIAYQVVYNDLTFSSGEDPSVRLFSWKSGLKESEEIIPYQRAGIVASPPARNGYVVRYSSAGKFLIVSLMDNRIVEEIPMEGDAVLENEMSIAISPEGDKIAYSDFDESSNTNKTYIVNIDGSNLVTLDVGAADKTFMRFSPDGNYIAFFDLLDINASNGRGSLYVASVDGSEVRQVTEVQEIDSTAMLFDWSPDGASIVYRDQADNTLYIASVDGSNKRKLARGNFPDWSPDGTRILYISSEDATVSIMNADGSGLRESFQVVALYPQWSPDGRQVLCVETLGWWGSDKPEEKDIPKSLLILSTSTKEILRSKEPIGNRFRYSFWL